MIIVGWLSSRLTPHASRVWFLRPTIFLEGLALAAVIGVALLVKRLGQPLGVPALNNTHSSGLFLELLNTATYQTSFHFTWLDTIKFLSRQFGVRSSEISWLDVGGVDALAGGRASESRHADAARM